MGTLFQDVRYGFRMLMKNPAMTLVAAMTLALGIGANTAMFSVINAALFRRSALSDPERLVDIYQNASNAGALDGNSYPAYLDIATYTDVFASTTAATRPRAISEQ